MNRDPLVVGETYHVYNRGAHKQPVFLHDVDYKRFQLLLYLANGTRPIQFSNLLQKYGGSTSIKIYEEVREGEGLVDILAYSLLPNHFHLVLRQRVDQGISNFMRRLITSYTMYFNAKYDHSGVLFQGRYRSRHVNDEAYFRWIFSYVHLNAVELISPDWENIGILDSEKVRDFMREYRYSSYIDYMGDSRSEGVILTATDIPDFLKSQNDLEDMLRTYNGKYGG